MSTTKLLAAAAAVVFLAMPTARAAALPLAPAPRPIDVSGWYLRGDIGFSNQDVRSLSNALDNSPGISVQRTGLGFDAAPIFGLGVGYQWNSWFRVDLTGQYAGKSS